MDEGFGESRWTPEAKISLLPGACFKLGPSRVCRLTLGQLDKSYRRLIVSGCTKVTICCSHRIPPIRLVGWLTVSRQSHCKAVQSRNKAPKAKHQHRRRYHSLEGRVWIIRKEQISPYIHLSHHLLDNRRCVHRSPIFITKKDRPNPYLSQPNPLTPSTRPIFRYASFSSARAAIGSPSWVPRRSGSPAELRHAKCFLGSTPFGSLKGMANRRCLLPLLVAGLVTMIHFEDVDVRPRRRGPILQNLDRRYSLL